MTEAKTATRKESQTKWQVVFTILLLALPVGAAYAARVPVTYGALPWFAWVGLFAAVALLAFSFIIRENALGRKVLPRGITKGGSAEPARASGAPDGPSYPHPKIETGLCIGCYACVEACPHDVLTVLNGVAAVVAVEQCTEDASCQVECPTFPKACVIVNPTKKIPERQVPKRDEEFMTNVPGIYLIGDVSGVPLIKNAVNEGGRVIDHIEEDLRKENLQRVSRLDADQYDVAIIGIGPAGLSATASAKSKDLKYIAIEKGQAASMIREVYPAKKLVNFKPEDMPARGGIPLPERSVPKEALLGIWERECARLKINDEEECEAITKEGDGFVITTTKDNQPRRYKARRIIIAVGNHGKATELKIPGADLKGKVRYKVQDPNQYRGKHCLVVGAGNSAVEAAVDLAAFRTGSEITGWRDNDVSIVIRGELKRDVVLENKMMIYECLDAGRMRVFRGIKCITDSTVVVTRDDPEKPEEIKNDHVFAFIGGEKPTQFLTRIGIEIRKAGNAETG